MPSRAGAGTSGPRGKLRGYKHKQNYRKTNTSAARRHTQQQETSPSDPEPRLKRPRLTSRSSSQNGNALQVNLPLPSRYNQHKQWRGIFGSEREPGNTTLLRRQNTDMPKGNIPSWLAETFGTLPKKHPLREVVADPTVTESAASGLDDDDPFAYQPPSPRRAPSTTQPTAFPDVAQWEHPKPNDNLPYRMSLSSIPFCPPTFIEPTYEDHYQDVTIPLNDYGDDNEPENSAHWARTPFTTRPEVISPVFGVTSQSATPRRTLSPLFLSDIYLSSPIAITPVPNAMSSDDITLPTPTHNDILGLEPDETQGALRVKYPSITPMNTSSPTRSLRELPLGTLMGSRELSPYGLASTCRDTLPPNTIHRQYCFFEATGQDDLLEEHLQPPSVSSDIYKSRLLAYATVVADRMSNSGDEGLMLQQPIESTELKTEWRAIPSVTRRTPSPIQSSERPSHTLQSPLIEGSELSERYDGLPVALGSHSTVPDPDNCIELERAKPSAIIRSGDHTTSIQSTFPERGPFNGDHCGDDLDQTTVGNNLNLTETTCLEDPENNEPRVEDSLVELEDRPLLSQYKLIQVDPEYDVPAADEPSDEEGEIPQQQIVPTFRQGSNVTPEVDNLPPATMASPPENNTKIQAFPMKASRHVATPDSIAPREEQPMLTRLSPKFVTQLPVARHARYGHCAALFKKRVKDYPHIVKVGNQPATGMEDRDEIEPWP